MLALILLFAQDDIAERAGSIDPDVRAAALKEAQALENPSSKTILTLLGKYDASKLLKESDPVARRVACEKLAVKSEHVDALLKMLDDDSVETRIAATRALSRVTDATLRQTILTALMGQMTKKRSSSFQILYYFVYSVWYAYPIRLDAYLGVDQDTTEVAIAALANLPGSQTQSSNRYLAVLRDDKIERVYKELLLKTVTRTNPGDAFPFLTLPDAKLRKLVVEAIDRHLDDPMQAKTLYSYLPEAGPLTDGRDPSRTIREWIGIWIQRLCGQDVTLDAFETWWKTNHRAMLDKQIAAAIRKGSAALHKMSWDWNSQYAVGVTGMAVYTLIKCGYELGDEKIEKGLDLLLERDPEGTYSAALVAMALAAAIEKQKERNETTDGKIARRLQLIADMLAASQTRSGGWTYSIVKKPGTTDKPMDGNYDLSNTQFAVLGLRAAANGGAKIQKGIWEKALALFEKIQGSDGGWPYSGSGSSYTMSAAGMMGWLVCKLSLDAKSKPETLLRESRMERGLKYFENLLRASLLTEQGYYWLYSLERMCMTAGVETIAKRDWYEEGATWLVKEQRSDGVWVGSYGTAVDTCFALLFLTRAYITRPDVETPRRATAQAAAEVFRKHQEAIRAIAGVADVIVDEDSTGALLLVWVTTDAAEKELRKKYGDSISGVPLKIQRKP